MITFLFIIVNIILHFVKNIESITSKQTTKLYILNANNMICSIIVYKFLSIFVRTKILKKNVNSSKTIKYLKW